MLTSDATFGANDVGWPMTIKNLKQFQKDCSLLTVADEGRPLGMPGRNIVLVDASYHCSKTDRLPEREMVFTYMVEGDHIAGARIR